ncbi:related to Altered inheritance rate of mitochondria protein 29 [Melanopsichium pennsylvanicum]|uniref:Related to Altered inheritance rate of mitochondria protein 29 n=1 Tax=Melanopsichium pennsylvanicum TaxID=63383 RepID=A0AAJ5C6N3_9BASI|nr:related to Altered inheritance rate of mitochondria protein 29 [Melanopsichium pennsylvanicum]
MVESTEIKSNATSTLLPGGFHAFNPQSDFIDNTITNVSRPLTDSVITIRIIKSFEFRSMKAFVLKHIDLTKVTIADLEEQCRQEVRTNSTFRAFRSFAEKLDTLKLYTKAHGSKTTNLIINLDHDDWVLVDENLSGLVKESNIGVERRTKTNITLAQIGVENEAELSLFNYQAYETFLANPNTKWDATG